jgi:molybdopterin converting factor small subunit
MTLSVKLYGELKGKHPHKKKEVGIPNTVFIEITGLQTVLEILKQLNIHENEISHVFVNGIYSGAGKIVKDGDRIGIFPRRMAIMFLEITTIKSIFTQIIFHEDLRNYGPDKAIVELPEGSTVYSVLKKYNLIKQKESIEIIVNGKPIHDLDYILKDWDNIALFPIQLMEI